ncbi:hypothetical protein MAR_023764 [Mya arenaria]|uniref:EF-hand domain-containing protein n=1 Tax=Mya arenaria TaxID=6604 RepID=A0ABY7DNW1_MYAAR|nr:hypothetical protein MAR_023764 [Mya arenaria]
MAKSNDFLDNMINNCDSAENFNVECIDHYDNDRDGYLNFQECCSLLEDVCKSTTYKLSREYKDRIFNLLDEDKNDFISGSLSLLGCPAGHDGAEVIPVINHLLDSVPFDLVVYTKDWHPENHISFVENVQNRPLAKNCKHSGITTNSHKPTLYESLRDTKSLMCYTALHALEHGFRTVLVDDACKGVDAKGIEETKRKLVDSGGIIVHSSQREENV